MTCLTLEDEISPCIIKCDCFYLIGRQLPLHRNLLLLGADELFAPIVLSCSVVPRVCETACILCSTFPREELETLSQLPCSKLIDVCPRVCLPRTPLWKALSRKKRMWGTSHSLLLAEAVVKVSRAWETWWWRGWPSLAVELWCQWPPLMAMKSLQEHPIVWFRHWPPLCRS